MKNPCFFILFFYSRSTQYYPHDKFWLCTSSNSKTLGTNRGVSDVGLDYVVVRTLDEAMSETDRCVWIVSSWSKHQSSSSMVSIDILRYASSEKHQKGKMKKSNRHKFFSTQTRGRATTPPPLTHNVRIHVSCNATMKIHIKILNTRRNNEFPRSENFDCFCRAGVRGRDCGVEQRNFRRLPRSNRCFFAEIIPATLR